MAQADLEIVVEAMGVAALVAEMKELNNLMRQMVANANGAVGGIDNVGSHSQQSSKKVGGLNDSIGGLKGAIGALGLAIGAAEIVGFGKQAFEESLKFGQAAANLQSITGVTAEGLEFFKDSALEMAATSTIAAADVLKAFELVGSAKPELLGSQEALKGVTDAAITLAEASGMALPDAASALTGAMNQFGAGADQATRYINVLAASSLAGAADISSVVEAIKPVGSVMAGFNVSVEQGAALIETLADKSLKGAEAGTALRNILLTMQGAAVLPKEAQESMARMGIDIGLVSDKAAPLNKRLAEMAKLTGDANAMIKVFGKENVNAANIVFTNLGRYEALNSAVTGTTTAFDQASQRTTTLAAQLEKAANIVNVEMIKLGDAMAPVIQDFIKGFGPALEYVKKTLYDVYDGFGPLFEAIGNIAKQLGIASEETSAFEMVIKGLATAFKIATLPMQGVVWVIGKIADGIAGYIGFAKHMISKTYDIKNAFDLLLIPVKAVMAAYDYFFGEEEINKAEALSKSIQLFAKKAQEEFGATGEQIHAFTKTLNAADFAGKSMAEGSELLREKFAAFMAAQNKSTEAALENTESLNVNAAAISDVGKQAAKASEDVDKFTHSMLGAAEPYLLQQAMDAKKAADALAATKKEADDLAWVLSEGSKPIQQGNTLANAVTKDMEMLLSVFEASKGKFGPLSKEVKDQLAEGFGGLGEVNQQLSQMLGLVGVSDFSQVLGDAGDAMTQISETTDPIVEKMNQMVIALDVTKLKFEQLAESIKTKVSGAFKDFAVNAVQSIGYAIGAGESLQDAFMKAIGGLLVEVPRLAGFAMLNTAAGMGPNPAALGLALGGLGLIGLSGIMGGMMSRLEEQQKTQNTPQIPQNLGNNARPQAVSGLASMESNFQPQFVVMIDGEKVPFTRIIRQQKRKRI